MKPILSLLALAALLAGCSTTSLTPKHAPLLDRVAVIGASMSSGAGLRHELGAEVSLVPVLESVLAPQARGPEAAPILDLGTYFMFKSPVGVGTTLVDATVEHQATLVIAVDFLFWFVHGELAEEQRVERLELGLALLDRLPSPMLVGDLPDITYALSGRHRIFGGPIIPPHKIPSEATRALCNQRIRAWAQARPRVSLAPFEHFAAEALAGNAIKLPHSGVITGGPDVLIQQDHLHPTLDGSIALLLIAMNVFIEEQAGLAAHHIQWNPAVIRQLSVDRTKHQRDAARARKDRIRSLRQAH